MRSKRGRARLRSRVRLCLAKWHRFVPQRAERELFSAAARYYDNRYFCDNHYLLHSGLFTAQTRPKERAARLLLRNLSSVQRRCVRRRNFFVVTGRSGRRFRVWARRSYPVELLDSTSNAGGIRESQLYCVNTELEEYGSLPLGDFLLELKLCLEADETYFLLNSNPNFQRGQADKELLVKKRLIEGVLTAD